MKKALLFLQYIFFICFIGFLFLGILDVTNRKMSLFGLDHSVPKYNGIEKFDPSLAKLGSVKSLIEYCDSIYKQKILLDPSCNTEDCYPLVVSMVVRDRFYHGYSSYGVSDNFMALLLEPLTGKWMSAIVVPDDIMKYPYAACSQQSIVMMAVLNSKGYTTRKVAFINGKEYGHFAFEAYYGGGWHFFDPNLEPKLSVLNAYNNPPVETLANNKELLLAAYDRMPADQMLKIFAKYTYGKPNTFPAPHAIIYQKVTKILSYTVWIFFLAAFLFVRRKYQKISYQKNVRNNWIYFLRSKRKGSSSYHEGYRASRA